MACNEDDVTVSVLLDSRVFSKISDFTLFESQNFLEIVTVKQFRNQTYITTLN